ncbi:MAG: hypothetical protein GX981_00810, partial [Tissierellia bacterium]|nr:hypothetical protein [Tissierellia bacterium]
MEFYGTRKKVNMKSFLLKRLNTSFLDIENTYLKFNNKNLENLPKGSEWLLDNFYILELVYKETKANILREKKIELNIIETGIYKGYPLVYALSLELINYFTGNINEENIIEFINGFQKWGILSLEEVSSISTCLIIGLLEYISKISAKLSTIDEIWQKEYVLQSKYKISLGYGIKSLRAMANFDWENIFESIAVVEEIYKKDPLNVYESMDLDSKHYYRYNTKILAEKFNVEEVFLAKKILEFAEEEWNKGSRDKKAHIGYYLLDKGREKLFDFFGIEEKTTIYMKKYSSYYLPILLLTIFVSISIFIYTYNRANVFL